MKLVVLCLVGLAAVGFAAEFLTNGSFEAPLANGWAQYAYPDYSTYNFDVGPDYAPDADNELYVYKYDANVARIDQTVSVPNVDLFFSYAAKFKAVELNSSSTYWAAAGLSLIYRNEFGAALGETRIAGMTAHCPWSSSATFHVIAVPDTNWNSAMIDVAAELGNLPGVNAADVKQITVAVADTTDGC
jgi:hypothetical protein